MKKFFYLFAIICSVCMFTACSDDDDKKEEFEETKSALVGTWNVEATQVKDEGLYDGSVKMTWDVPTGTSINVDMGFGTPIPMDINETIVPLVCNLANSFLPQVLKSVTFDKNGNITAMYRETDGSDDDGALVFKGDWQTATGYATYQVVGDNLIKVYLNADKIIKAGEDAEDKQMLQNILQQFGEGFPVNVRWNADKSKAYFFVDKAFVTPAINTLNKFIESIPESSLDEDDLATFNMLKAIITQLPDIMNQTKTFEAGIELERQK